MSRAVCLLGLVLVAGCALLKGATGPDDVERRTEIVLEPVAGWEGVVRIDSVSWLPAFADIGGQPSEDRLEGTFAARFTNLSARRVQVRYDLRFYDPDEFLIDIFFPFGQPVMLTEGEVRWVKGEFYLDVGAKTAQWLAVMRLVACPGPPEE